MIRLAKSEAQDTIETANESAIEPELENVDNGLENDNGVSQAQIQISWGQFWNTSTSPAESPSSEVVPPAIETTNIANTIEPVPSAKSESKEIDDTASSELNNPKDTASSAKAGSIGSLKEFNDIVAKFHHTTLQNILNYLTKRLSTNFDQYASVCTLFFPRL